MSSTKTFHILLWVHDGTEFRLMNKITHESSGISDILKGLQGGKLFYTFLENEMSETNGAAEEIGSYITEYHYNNGYSFTKEDRSLYYHISTWTPSQ
jgi:hypothetical protein